MKFTIQYYEYLFLITSICHNYLLQCSYCLGHSAVESFIYVLVSPLYLYKKTNKQKIITATSTFVANVHIGSKNLLDCLVFLCIKQYNCMRWAQLYLPLLCYKCLQSFFVVATFWSSCFVHSVMNKNTSGCIRRKTHAISNGLNVSY